MVCRSSWGRATVRTMTWSVPENGWQIPPDNLSALTESLRMALSDAALLRNKGAESYRIVAEEINLEKMVGVFINALNSVK